MLAATVVTAILWVLGVQMAYVFGIITFVLNFIPNLGPMIATFLPMPLVVLDPGGSSHETVICCHLRKLFLLEVARRGVSTELKHLVACHESVLSLKIHSAVPLFYFARGLDFVDLALSVVATIATCPLRNRNQPVVVGLFLYTRNYVFLWTLQCTLGAFASFPATFVIVCLAQEGRAMEWAKWIEKRFIVSVRNLIFPLRFYLVHVLQRVQLMTPFASPFCSCLTTRASTIGVVSHPLLVVDRYVVFEPSAGLRPSHNGEPVALPRTHRPIHMKQQYVHHRGTPGNSPMCASLGGFACTSICGAWRGPIYRQQRQRHQL